MKTDDLAKIVNKAQREAELAMLQIFARLRAAGVSIKDFSVGGTVITTDEGLRFVNDVHVDFDVDWRGCR